MSATKVPTTTESTQLKAGAEHETGTRRAVCN